MKEKLKKLLSYLSIGIVTAFLTHLVIYGQIISNQAPHKNLNRTSKISNVVTVSNKKVVKRSRLSSVRVLSLDVANGMISTSSGTYFTYKNTNYIITTSHGLLGGCDSVQIESAGELYDCIELVKVDKLNDYAILEVENILDRKAIIFPKNFVSSRNGWNKSLTLLNNVVYTGYPNSIGPLTIDGSIMGFDPQGLIYIQSYAWSGSSGSGVFDQSGKLIGYILAIDIGQNEYGTAILENVMIVVPIYKVDWSVIFERGKQK
jgi:S1-C subfamily serine protease|tara:strand:- start:1675 stop:2457 length:783 start_codon:yes stop_codon:yes gene_type:complete